jgi:hypothetical protein
MLSLVTLPYVLYSQGRGSYTYDDILHRTFESLVARVNMITTEIISPNHQYMAVIEHRENSLYLVEVFKWTREYVEGYGEVCDPYWTPVAGPMWTDTLAQANLLALQELHIHDSQTASAEATEQENAIGKAYTGTIKASLNNESGQIWIIIKLHDTWFRGNKDRDIRDDIIAYVEEKQLGSLDGTSSGAGAMDINFYVDNKQEAGHKLDTYIKTHHKDLEYYISDTYEVIFDYTD